MKKLIIPIVTLLLYAAGVQTGNAQDKTSFSLTEAQDFALLNSTAIKNADIDLDLAKKKIWETTAIGLPQVSAQANYQHLFTVPEIAFPITVLGTSLGEGVPITSDDITNGNVYMYPTTEGAPVIPLAVKDNTTLDITVSQLVFSGEYLVGLRASRVFYMISDQAKRVAEIDAMESIANTYSLVLMLQNSYDVMSQSLTNLNVTLNEMREMYKQGFIEITDVDQIELTSLTLQNGINAMERQLGASKQLLKFQMGYPLEKDIALTDNLEALAAEVQLEPLISNGFKLQNNISFQIMETQVKLNKLNLQREQSTFLPSLAAVYRHTEKFKKIDFDFTPTDVFALSLNIPIFSSGQRYVKVQQRRLEYDKAVNNRDNAGRGLELEYINAKNEMISAYDTYNNVKRNLELTKRIYDKTLIKFKEGLSTSMDLTQAQGQFLTAQSEYIKNLNSLLTAKNKLTKLTNQR